jgi:hypothetical protein
MEQSSQSQDKEILADSKLEALKKKYETQMKVLQKHVEYKEKKLQE